MTESKLLLNAYYETLYERLEAKKGLLVATIEKLLADEIKKRGFVDFDEEKYAAYRDACLAFVDERIETYNPIGIQYTFDRIRAREALELELQLNWYDSQAEFEELVQAVRDKTEVQLTERLSRTRVLYLLMRLSPVFPSCRTTSSREQLKKSSGETAAL